MSPPHPKACNRSPPSHGCASTPTRYLLLLASRRDTDAEKVMAEGWLGSL